MDEQLKYYEEAKTIAIKIFNKRYFQHLEKEELISEAYLWTAKNIHNLENKTEKHITRYLYISLKNHFDKILTKKIEDKINNMYVPAIDNNNVVFETSSNYNSMAIVEIDGEEKFFDIQENGFRSISNNIIVYSKSMIKKMIQNIHDETASQEEKEAFNSLNKTQKKYLTYKYAFGLDQYHIAERSDTTPSAVVSSIYRAEKALKVKLGNSVNG